MSRTTKHPKRWQGRSLTLLVTLILLLTLAVGGTVAYVVVKAGPVRNQFISGYPAVGSVAVHKVVEHPFGDGYQVPENENTQFHFSVALGAENAGQTFGDFTADESGVVSLTVGAGQTVTVPDIPAGTAVTVTELEGNAGFTVQGDAARTVEVQRDTVSTLNFTNVYAPAQPNKDAFFVRGDVDLVGRDWLDDDIDICTFLLEIKRDGQWVELAQANTRPEFAKDGLQEPNSPMAVIPPDAELMATQGVKPESLAFDFTEDARAVMMSQPGVYSFRIVELQGPAPGVVYDSREALFDVTVGDADMDGYLEIQSITSPSEITEINGHEVIAHFLNRYELGTTHAEIKITKELLDESGQNKLPSGFTFELLDEIGNVIVTSLPTGAAGETKIRLDYGPEDANQSYRYVLKEKNAGETIQAVSYDNTEFRLRVDVVDNLDGTLSAYIYDDDGQESQDLTQPEEIEEAGESVEETLESVEAEAPENEPEDLPEEVEEARESVEETLESVEAEEIVEETLESVEAEALENEPEDLPEEVADDVPSYEELAMLLALSVPADATASYEAEFLNVYDPSDASVTLGGRKELTGRELRTGEFSFLLYETDANFQIAEGAVPIATAVNDENGAFQFDQITLNRVGSYYYLVLEDASGAISGVSYDTKRYGVTVTVTDQENALAADTAVSDQTGAAGEIVFRNSYVPGSTSLTLRGEKILNGKVLNQGDFSFELLAADESFQVSGSSLQTAINEADGSFAFNPISYSAVGTWYYVVRENNSMPMAGVAYDASEYHVTVNVTDDGNGSLSAAAQMLRVRDGESAAAESLAFENSYSSAYAVLTLQGEKILEGTTLRDGMFRFILYASDAEYQQGEEIEKVYNSQAGEILFHALTFTEPGEYYYLVKEDDSTSLNNISFDATVYGVCVIVTEDGSGQLKAELKLTKVGGGEADKIVFTNVYSKPGTGGGGSGGSGKVRTGDESAPWLWAALMLLSATGLIAVWRRRRAQNRG